MKYENVLVPLDCSRLAESVLPYAVSLSDKFGLDIILYHACSPEGCHSVAVHKDYINRKVEVIKSWLSRRENIVGKPLQARAVEVRGVSGVGYPAEEIIRYSNENGISLVLVSRHGQSGIRQWVIGSTADKVIRASTVPVCLVQVPFSDRTFNANWPMGKIVVLLDGSKEAESILPYVEALASQQIDGSPGVILFTVFDPQVSLPFPNYSAVQHYLTGLEKGFHADKLQVSQVIHQGKPAREIIAHANSDLTPFDLIAMTTYGESSLNGHGLGSITEKVISEVSTPILMVRPG